MTTDYAAHSGLLSGRIPRFSLLDSTDSCCSVWYTVGRYQIQGTSWNISVSLFNHTLIYQNMLKHS